MENTLPFLPIEVISESFYYVTDSKTFKQLLFVCKYVHKVHIHRKDKFCNHLLTLVERWGFGFFNSNYVYRNVNVTMKYIDEHANILWDKESISFNPNLTLDYVLKNPGSQWGIDGYNWIGLSCIPSLTIEDVKAHPEIKWRWDWISQHRNITMEDIENNKKLPWDVRGVVWNPNLTTKYIDEHMDLFDENCNDWQGISESKCVTLEYIIVHPNYPWYWYGISARNPNVTMSCVKNHPNLPWEYGDLSAHINITMDDIEQNMNLSWEWQEVSINPNLTIEFIEKHTELHSKFSWFWISQHKNITLKYIDEHTDLPWNWAGVSRNPNLTSDYIINHPLIKWDWEGISMNTFGKCKNATIKLRM
jgi:hypothetical protein